MNTPMEFRIKWHALLKKFESNSSHVILSKKTIYQLWADFDSIVEGFYTNLPDPAKDTKVFISKEEAMTRRIQAASAEWWEHKGSIPLLFISKKHNVPLHDLSMHIDAQIFDKSGVAKPPPPLTLLETVYFENKGPQPEQHLF